MIGIHVPAIKVKPRNSAAIGTTELIMIRWSERFEHRPHSHVGTTDAQYDHRVRSVAEASSTGFDSGDETVRAVSLQIIREALPAIE